MTRQAPQMIPAMMNQVVSRERLTSQLLNVLLAEPGTVGLTTALQGAGGFGKTTLAASVGRSGEVAERFPDGVLWITIGEQTSGAELASKINDLSEILSGERPTLSDPESAGHRLGDLLEAKSVLLVVDDVWTRAQLRPLLQGSPSSTRLVTTRIRNVLPPDCHSIEVDAMETSEALLMLGAGLEQFDFEDPIARDLVRLTGRWPVLLELVNGSLRRLSSSGGSVDDALRLAHRRLKDAGPTGFDVSRPSHREEAVAATMQSSFQLLDKVELTRFEELAIFPEDALIPRRVLATLWGRTADMSTFDSERLCDDFEDLSLVKYNVSDEVSLSLHDVIRSYIRRSVGLQRLVDINRELVEAYRRDLTASESDDRTCWWELNTDNSYLWRNLCYHLSEASYLEQARSLVGDLRWCLAKIERDGTAHLEADLSIAGGRSADQLGRAIGGLGELLRQANTRGVVSQTLVTRLYGKAGLVELVHQLRMRSGLKVLKPGRPLPDGPDPALRRVLRHGGGRLLACSTNESGTVLVGGGESDGVTAWDVETGRVVQAMDGHLGAVFACATEPDGGWVATAGDDQTIRIWDLESGNCTRSFDHPEAAIRALVIAPDGGWIASAGDECVVTIVDLSDGSRFNLSGHDAPIRALAVDPQGEWLASAGDDLTIRVWDIAGRFEKLLIQGVHADSVQALSAGPEGEWIASCSLEGSVCLWNTETGHLISRFATNSGPVLAHGPSQEGRWMVTGGDEGEIQIWDLAQGLEAGALKGHSGRIRSWAADPRGSWLTTAGDDQTIRMWDMTEFGANIEPEHTERLWCCVPEGDLGTVLAAGDAGQIERTDISTGESIVMAMFPTAVFGISHQQGTDLIAVVGQTGEVGLYDKDGHKVWLADGHKAAASACTFVGDLDLLVSVGRAGATKVWKLSTGSAIAEHYRKSPITSCSAIPSSNLVAIAGEDGLIQVLSLPDMGVVAEYDALSQRVYVSASNVDATHLATGGLDGMIRLWDWRKGQVVGVFEGHEGRILDVKLVDDYVLSTSMDYTVRMWRTATTEQVFGLRVGAPLFSADLLRDPRGIIAVGDFGLYMLLEQDSVQ